MRNNIQKMKIDMANEVIDAGRFDMQTSMEERKQTLEALLQVSLTCLCMHSHELLCFTGLRFLLQMYVSCTKVCLQPVLLLMQLLLAHVYGL